MDSSSANPYSPPTGMTISSNARSRDLTLLPLWIWLGIAVLSSFLGTAADPIEMLIALAYGLVSFWVGAIHGSSLPFLIRIVSTLLWCIAALALIALSVVSFFSFIGPCYLLASVALGYWASRRIKDGRLPIILWFSVGYVLGSGGGPLGTVAGAVVGAVGAKKSLPKSEDSQRGINPDSFSQIG